MEARASIQWRAVARLAFGLVVVASGVGALAVAQGPGRLTTYAGHSELAATLTFVAGVALVLAGVMSLGRPASRIGDLALLAGFVWFAPVWVGWVDRPSLVRSLGMLSTGFVFPLLLRVVLAYPNGHVQTTAGRLLVGAAYVETSLSALGRALFRDPFFDPNCWANCTDNVFLVRSLPSLAHAIEVADRWFAVATAAAFATICVWRLLRHSEPARRALLPVVPPAFLLAGAIAAHSITLHRVALEDPSDPVFSSIFVITSAAVTLLAAGLVWASLPHAASAPRSRPDRDQPRPSAPSRFPRVGTGPGRRRPAAPDRLLAAKLAGLCRRERSAASRTAAPISDSISGAPPHAP